MSQGRQSRGKSWQILLVSSLREPQHSGLLEGWTLNVDETSNNKDSKIKIILTTPEGTIIEQPYTLGFLAANNEDEYEAVTERRLGAIHYQW